MSKFIFVLMFLLSMILKSQNLVPNPSFDDYRGRRPSMHPWQMINSIDFFIYEGENSKQRITSNVKDKNFRLRPARTGKAYVGLRVWPNYHEFLQVELLEKLERNSKYYFEFYVVISNHSNSYLKTLGASFYETKPPYTSKSAYVNFPPQIRVFDASGIGNSGDWTKISGEFYARGDERFLTIGNFSTARNSKFKKRKLSFKKNEAYYYIDDVALYKLDDNNNPILEKPSEDLISQNLLLPESDEVTSNFGASKYVAFAENSSDLTYQSYKQLASYIEHLNKNPETEIVLLSYTSSNPAEKSNTEKLALSRARAIQIFISGNRINRQRISIVNVEVANDEYVKSLDLKKIHVVELLLTDNKNDLMKIDFLKNKN